MQSILMIKLIGRKRGKNAYSKHSDQFMILMIMNFDKIHFDILCLIII